MNSKGVDIASMLDDLNLSLASQRWKELANAPELADYTPYQLFREVLDANSGRTVQLFRN